MHLALGGRQVPGEIDAPGSHLRGPPLLLHWLCWRETTPAPALGPGLVYMSSWLSQEGVRTDPGPGMGLTWAGATMVAVPSLLAPV